MDVDEKYIDTKFQRLQVLCADFGGHCPCMKQLDLYIYKWYISHCNVCLPRGYSAGKGPTPCVNETS